MALGQMKQNLEGSMYRRSSIRHGEMLYQSHTVRKRNSDDWVVFKHSTQYQGVRSRLVAWVMMICQSRTTHLQLFFSPLS